jgi:nucleoside-diphosphate-sugar epimerase
MNILITGSSGVIGSILLNSDFILGHKVFSYDLKDHIINNVTDVGRLSKIILDNNIDTVIHLASIHDPRESLVKTEKYREQYLSECNLLRIFNKMKIKQLIIPSNKKLGLNKDPFSSYKLMLEEFIKTTKFNYKIKLVRLDNVIGNYTSFDHINGISLFDYFLKLKYKLTYHHDMFRISNNSSFSLPSHVINSFKLSLDSNSPEVNSEFIQLDTNAFINIFEKVYGRLDLEKLNFNNYSRNYSTNDSIDLLESHLLSIKINIHNLLYRS